MTTKTELDMKTRLLTNSLVPRHGRRGEFHGRLSLHPNPRPGGVVVAGALRELVDSGDCHAMKFGETRKPRFSGFELTKSRDGLCRRSGNIR